MVFLKARWPLFLDLLYRENICKCSDIGDFLSLIWLSKCFTWWISGFVMQSDWSLCTYPKTWKRLKSGPLLPACISDKGNTAQCLADKKKVKEEEGRTRMEFLLTNCFNHVYLLSDRVTLTLPLLMLTGWGSDSDFWAPSVSLRLPHVISKWSPPEFKTSKSGRVQRRHWSLTTDS